MGSREASPRLRLERRLTTRSSRHKNVQECMHINQASKWIAAYDFAPHRASGAHAHCDKLQATCYRMSELCMQSRRQHGNKDANTYKGNKDANTCVQTCTSLVHLLPGVETTCISHDVLYSLHACLSTEACGAAKPCLQLLAQRFSTHHAQ
eukprot:366209-Chlamydomonas_euryale.AAC.16